MTFTVSFVASPTGGNEMVQARVRRSGTTMPDFASALQNGLDRPVIDGTGLEGRFDVEYTHAPQPPSATADSPFGAPPPMLFVALEEQLGLKLEAVPAPYDVLVRRRRVASHMTRDYSAKARWSVRWRLLRRLRASIRL